MKTVSASELRSNLAAALDAVGSDAEELVITRARHEPLLVVPPAEYASLRETDYLLRSPARPRSPPSGRVGGRAEVGADVGADVRMWGRMWGWVRG
ncbi:type II toxin-antitoxin system Phd/YefM family antitoxin [Kitasatospora sp. NPDC092948]|uniref:type II toxin-antitoxin system Phd/YefM family antitoxin n=1 Tax=Kitasatospora sp. NPDC092948 TaxID=3364088 RepID=UPI00380EFCDA